VFTYLKVLIAFVTIATTVDTQFGVIWPSAFATALGVLSAMSFDFSVVGGAFCVINMSFYGRYIHSTTIVYPQYYPY
jgi:hypothetical protein